MSMHTAELAKSLLDRDAAEAGAEIAKNPGSAGRIANSLANRQGTYDAFVEWEREMADMATFAESENWSDLRITATKHRILAQMALRPVGDEWSGRGNDERRSYHDGRREALSELYYDMSADYGNAVQGTQGVLA
jgi:hypothetical protein